MLMLPFIPVATENTVLQFIQEKHSAGVITVDTYVQEDSSGHENGYEYVYFMTTYSVFHKMIKPQMEALHVPTRIYSSEDIGLCAAVLRSPITEERAEQLSTIDPAQEFCVRLEIGRIE